MVGRGAVAAIPTQRYSFYETKILELPCLLMVDQGEEALAASTVRKQMDQVRAKWPGEIITCAIRSLHINASAARAEGAVPCSGNQMYLPMLGIDLREHFRQLRQRSPTLSPATQVVVLHLLLGGELSIYTPAELAERLGYTRMTMTRVQRVGG